MRRLLAIALLVAVALAVAPAALALDRVQATKLALAALRPEGQPGRVVVFAGKRPLAAIDSVFDAATATAKAKDTVAAKSLGKKAWLFWEDLQYGARFQHRSVVLLLDDASGAVLLRQKLHWFPLVSGHVPEFVRPAYYSAEYRVYASDAVTRAAPAGATRTPALRLVPPAAAVRDDCIIFIGLRRDPQFKQDFDGITAAARANGIRVFRAESDNPNLKDPDGSDLRDDVKTLTKPPHNCKDVMVYIDGHGYERGATAVNVGVRLRDSGKTNRKGEKLYYRDTALVRATDIEELLRENRGTTFKLVIDSCFSARFILDVPADEHPNLLVMAVSSRANEVSYSYIAANDGVRSRTNNPGNARRDGYGRGEFTNGFLAGLSSFFGSAAELARAQAAGGDLLARAIDRAVTLGRGQDFAQTAGLTESRTQGNLDKAPPPATAFSVSLEGWYQHFTGKSAICVKVSTKPPRKGGDYSVSVTGGSVIGSRTATGGLDEGGERRVRFEIDQYDTYTVTVSVTSGGKTETATTTIKVTAAAGSAACG